MHILNTYILKELSDESIEKQRVHICIPSVYKYGVEISFEGGKPVGKKALDSVQWHMNTYPAKLCKINRFKTLEEIFDHYRE